MLLHHKTEKIVLNYNLATLSKTLFKGCISSASQSLLKNKNIVTKQMLWRMSPDFVPISICHYNFVNQKQI